ncbi:MAG TPA: LCP family protein [Baekduia sp.]|nr:LCP family protein [Baekduia sp.]
MPQSPEPPPDYTKYRAAPRFLRRSRGGDGPALDDLRALRPGAEPPPGGAGDGSPPVGDRRVYGGGRRGWGGLPGRRGVPRPRPGRWLARITIWRVVKWLALAVIGWTALSLVVFLVSAQIQQGDLSGKVDLGGAGFPLTSPNTILVLGSDVRPPDSKEPGAQTSGTGRSDSILLLRIGGGKNARLSIPRDTVVDIPGHGRDKINAAYAYGGPALAVQTIEQYLGLTINHLIEVNFQNFPDLIDAMGGIDYRGACVVSRINGGYSNGGYTLRLPAGTSHLDGKQALALARTRHNDCNPSESDLTRARRQQKILAAMKSRLISPWAFPRWPLIAWNTPKALRSDMSGPTLLGVLAAMATAGSPPTEILKPDGAEASPGGGIGLHVSDAEKQHAVQRFLRG